MGQNRGGCGGGGIMQNRFPVGTNYAKYFENKKNNTTSFYLANHFKLMLQIN